jgi:hypothetical protein
MAGDLLFLSFLLSFRTRRILAGEESASLPSPLFSYIVIPNPFAYFANGVSLPAYGGESAFLSCLFASIK